VLIGVGGLFGFAYIGDKAGKAEGNAPKSVLSPSPVRPDPPPAAQSNDLGFAPTPEASTAAAEVPTSPTGMKTCPDCAEEVRAAARKCRFCDYVLTSVPSPVDS